MIPGNLRPDAEIKEKDQRFYHVRLTSVRINSKDALHPIIKVSVKPFRPNDYKKYFKCKTEDQIAFLRSMGMDSAELVHDPTLNIEKTPVDPITLKEPVKVKNEADEKIDAENKLIEEARLNELAIKEKRIIEANKTPHKKTLKVK
jgi:hypothetical protein